MVSYGSKHLIGTKHRSDIYRSHMKSWVHLGSPPVIPPGDLSLGRGRLGLLQRSPELWAPSLSVAWKLAAATALLRPTDATSTAGVKHKAWCLGGFGGWVGMVWGD